MEKEYLQEAKRIRNNINFNKQRRTMRINQEHNEYDNNKDEVKQLREMLTNSNKRSINLENKLNKALELLSQQINQQQNNTSNHE